MFRTYDEQMKAIAFLNDLTKGPGTRFSEETARWLIETVPATADDMVLLKATFRPLKHLLRRRNRTPFSAPGIGTVRMDDDRQDEDKPLPIYYVGDYALVNVKDDDVETCGKFYVLHRNFATRYAHDDGYPYIEYRIGQTSDNQLCARPACFFVTKEVEVDYWLFKGRKRQEVCLKLPRSDVLLKAERARIGPWGPYPDKRGEPR